jgi:hypothetical protein
MINNLKVLNGIIYFLVGSMIGWILFDIVQLVTK